MIRIVLLVCVFLFATGPSRAQDITQAVGAIPPEVEGIRYLGSWKRDDVDGTYRLIVVRKDRESQRLFVQWVARPGDGVAARIVDTAEIAEFAALKTVITTLTFDDDGQDLALYIGTMKASNGDDTTYEAIIRAPDDILFGPASN